MIILTNYEILSHNGHYYVVSHERRACPRCQGTLNVRDSKRRKLILSDGDVRIFHLRRLKCTRCGRLHVELPDIFIPYKHYSRTVIEMAVSGISTDCPAENSTIYRWSKECEESFLY